MLRSSQNRSKVDGFDRCRKCGLQVTDRPDGLAPWEVSRLGESGVHHANAWKTGAPGIFGKVRRWMHLQTIQFCHVPFAGSRPGPARQRNWTKKLPSSSGKEEAHKHKQIFPVSPDRVARGLPTGGQGSKVYVPCAEPKEYKHFRPGTRPGGSVTGVTEKLFMCQMFMCLFRPLLVWVGRDRSGIGLAFRKRPAGRTVSVIGAMVARRS